MKNIIVQIFVSLGVIFLILIIIGVYFFVTDPYGLKPLLFGGSAPIQSKSAPISNEPKGVDIRTSTEPVVSGGFKLSSAQVDALISLGIDPSVVPSSISAEQETCFVTALGAERVQEIKTGAVPSAFEFLKAKSCI